MNIDKHLSYARLQNIASFKRQLETTIDPKRRALLQELLDAEQRALFAALPPKARINPLN